MQCKIVWLLLDVVVSSCLHKEEKLIILFHLISTTFFFIGGRVGCLFHTAAQTEEQAKEADASQFTVSRSISKKARLVLSINSGPEDNIIRLDRY